MFNFFKKNKANQMLGNREPYGQDETHLLWQEKHISTRQMEFLIGTGIGNLAIGLEFIYRTLYTREWNRNVPQPSEFDDITFIYNMNRRHFIFHRLHKKFGANIFEYDSSNRRNTYCFFDHSRLQDVMEWYDKFEDYEDDVASPPIPTYHALPEDRFYFNPNAVFYD